MAKNSRKSADSAINAVITIVLAAVIGLAGYAIYDKMSANLNEKAIASGEKEATVEYLAEQASMSVEDYLAQYGLSGISKKATQTEMTDEMTVDNYITYSGTTAEDLKTQYNLDEAPAGDAVWGDIRKALTVKNMVGDEESFKQFKEVYQLDDSITMDTLWTDAEAKIEESIQKMQEEAANATEAPATEAPAENAEESAEGEATEAPVEEAAE